MMKPIDLKVQNCESQTGIVGNPLFMWKYGPGEAMQCAYQITIFCEEEVLCTTGKVLSGEQNYIEVPVSLKPQTCYKYQVMVWDEQDNCYASENAYFITGVEKWRGQWIGNGTAKPFIACKHFVAKRGDEAVLSIAVPGQFEVLLNGKRISPYVYEGSQTDFHKHVHYCTYDVSPYLINGNNELTVEVANGWYIGDDQQGLRYFYTMDKGYEAFGQQLCLMVQLKLEEELITSDQSWQVAKSRTTLADIYGSEDMDATVEMLWEDAQVVEGPGGRLIPYSYPPIVEKRCYEAVAVEPDRQIYDFGQNMSSQFALVVKGKRGQILKVIPAEKLGENGDIEQTVDTYSLLTLSGGMDVFRQRFSVNGARWYKIEGLGDGEVISFKSYFVTSSATQTGTFFCSDERINRIFHLVQSAVESNLNHSHTDCPTIEKLGWLEPNHLMGKAVMYLKDVDSMWTKIAMDMRDSQYGLQEADIDEGAFPHQYKAGLIPSIAPRYARFTKDWGSGSFWDIIPWGSSVILAPYEQYLFYGNKKVLESNYESAGRYIEYLTGQYEEYPRIYGKNGEERFICAGLGDWGITQNGGNNRENIETAFYYHDLKIMSKIAHILGRTQDAEAYNVRAEQVCTQYNRYFLKEGKGYIAYDDGDLTQTNQAIPLCFGMVPRESVQTVQETLVRLCEGNHLACGEVGLVYILRALAAAGRNDIIYGMIMKEEHPSYLRFVMQGETTLPEFWRDDARSRNHDMMGHILEWFFAEVAGIKGNVGFGEVQVSPGLIKEIPQVTCEYDSIRGKICLKYDGKNGMTIETPCNVRVTKHNCSN